MLMPYKKWNPEIDPSSWIAEQAILIGRVSVGGHSSVWFNSVLRGDINYIKVGQYTNIQDFSILHVGDNHPVLVGDYVTVGHGARVHGCIINNNCLIGIGAIILNGATISDNTVIAAGALVPEGRHLEGRKLYMGVPVKPVRDLTDSEIELNMEWAKKYAKVAQSYKTGQ